MCSIYPRKTKSRTFGSCEATWDEVSASVVTAQRQTRAVYEVLRTTRVPHMLTSRQTLSGWRVDEMKSIATETRQRFYNLATKAAPSSRARQRGKGAALKSPRPGHCRRHGRACGQDGALRQPTHRTLVLAYSSTLERWEVSRIVGPPPHVTLPIISSPLWAHSDRRVGAGD
ncbi:unnamed protein product [Lampetra fluviatilis]